MLGKTAGGLFWMFRYLERSENNARLLETGLRIAMTRSAAAHDEWASLLTTAGAREAYLERHESFSGDRVIDFLLRDRSNPSSVLSVVKAARNDARLVRTALTREVWEATNECWMTLSELLSEPVAERDLPDALDVVRRQSALVRGAMHGTMLRNDGYSFARLGTFIERADSTARILDVKYFVLLPSAVQVGSSLDNVQWETILRSVSAQRAYRNVYGTVITARGIAEFLTLHAQMPRSLAFCYNKIHENLTYIARDYGTAERSHELVRDLRDRLAERDIDAIFEGGLHEFLREFLSASAAIASQIEQDYRFRE